jgi:hypothetical protein
MVLTFLTELLANSREIPDDIISSVFRDIISDMAINFDLKGLCDSSSIAKKADTNKNSAYGFHRPADTASGYSADLHLTQLAAHVLYYCGYDLHDELTQIVNNLTRETAIAPLDLFPNLYLPFLKYLLNEFPKEDYPIQGTPFRVLFLELLSTYLRRFVQQEPPRPSNAAAWPVTCSCTDCKVFSKFLLDLNQTVWRFPAAQKRRIHLLAMTKNTRCRFETETRSSPHVLVATKVETLHLAVVEAWKRRCGIAKGHLAKMPTEHLKELLEEDYESIMSLSILSNTSTTTNNDQYIGSQPPPGASALVPSYNALNRVLPPIPRRKTPHGVIVIDD